VGRILQNLPEAGERTIELNPEDVKKDNFPLLAHFTRLSVGVQSFSDSVLKTLGRDKLDYEKLLDLLSHWDVSVDLMVGVPGQTLTRFCGFDFCGCTWCTAYFRISFGSA